MNERADVPPGLASHSGPPADDPLAARVLPELSGEVKWGLDRMERILAALGDPHLDYLVLHVAGTNGKGSVARIWAEVLMAAGLSTGLYTSPHLVSFRERILVNGRPLPDELLVEWARDLKPLLAREAPSFFEAATALAFLSFSRAGVEAAVVEVGLGGRLDATNVVRPVLAVVTSLGLDHTEMLGGSLAEIAREKAGIFKPGLPVFTAVEDPSALAVLQAEAAEREARLRRVRVPGGRIRIAGVELELETDRWGPLTLESPMTGKHQLENIALAVSALEALPPRIPLSVGAVKSGVQHARVPGRFQVERRGARTWILDIAHNVSGARALRETLEAVAAPRPRAAIVGILADKPWEAILRELAPVVDHFILTVPRSAPALRRWRPEDALPLFPPGRVCVRPDPGAALEEARRVVPPTGSVIVTGSIYTVGEALACLGRIPEEALPVPFESG